jgi:hypothetical protein
MLKSTISRSHRSSSSHRRASWPLPVDRIRCPATSSVISMPSRTKSSSSTITMRQASAPSIAAPLSLLRAVAGEVATGVPRKASPLVGLLGAYSRKSWKEQPGRADEGGARWRDLSGVAGPGGLDATRVAISQQVSVVPNALAFAHRDSHVARPPTSGIRYRRLGDGCPAPHGCCRSSDDRRPLQRSLTRS